MRANRRWGVTRVGARPPWKFFFSLFGDRFATISPSCGFF